MRVYERRASRGDRRPRGSPQKIDGVDARLTVKIDALRTEVVAEIRRVDTRIDGMDRELRTAIDIRERLAALEARRAS